MDILSHFDHGGVTAWMQTVCNLIQGLEFCDESLSLFNKLFVLISLYFLLRIKNIMIYESILFLAVITFYFYSFLLFVVINFFSYTFSYSFLFLVIYNFFF